MTDPVIVEVTIAAPADAVWRALRDPREIRRWHGWDYESDNGGLDAEINMIYLDDVEVSDPDRTLDTGAGRFTLEPRGERTIVRLTRAAPTGQASWDGIYDEVNEGWTAFVHQLRYYLERHPGQDRHSFLLPAQTPVPEGELWYRAEHQVGVLLDGYGLLTTPGEERVLSVYGLDAHAADQVRERLTA